MLTPYTPTAANTLPATALPSGASVIEPIMLWWFVYSEHKYVSGSYPLGVRMSVPQLSGDSAGVRVAGE